MTELVTVLEATVSTKRKAMVVLMAVTVDSSSSGAGGDGNASSVLMVGSWYSCNMLIVVVTVLMAVC